MRPRALYQFDPYWRDQLFDAETHARLAGRLELGPEIHGADALRALPAAELARVELLLAGWGVAPLEAPLLDRMPALKAVIYAAGDPRPLVADGECFRRGVSVSTANAELARAVAEHTLGLVICSLKNVWRQSATTARERGFRREPGVGLPGAVIGLVAYGAIARALRALLRPFPVRVLVHDPALGEAEAAREAVERVSLETLFEAGDVVSCHLPLNAQTAGLLGAGHFRRLRRGATFINTARGAVLRQAELVAVLRERPDLWAVLDVLENEPPAPDDPVLDLPNLTCTPHVAGCLGPELKRLGRFAAAEVDRWLAGEPMLGTVRPDPTPAACAA